MLVILLFMRNFILYCHFLAAWCLGFDSFNCTNSCGQLFEINRTSLLNDSLNSNMNITNTLLFLLMQQVYLLLKPIYIFKQIEG